MRVPETLKKYYTELVDRAVKSAAQGAVLSIGVASALDTDADVTVNVFVLDFTLMLGMALGMAVLSLLTNIGQRGLFGKTTEEE